jgi:signal transduction histidine kinase
MSPSHALATKDFEQTPLPSPGGGLDEDARRSFLRRISHELRTPLNSIIGFSDVLRHQLCGPLGAPEYLEYAEIIGDSGARMLRMVNQIVEIVRLENQAAELDVRAEPLEGLVDEVLRGLAAEAETLNMGLMVDAATPMPAVQADARGLKTVLTNLVQNAMAHGPEGEAVVVRVRRMGRRVLIEVEDKGPGVDAREAPRLLRPFEKGPAPARGPEGAGLGLPIALLLCRAMGGDLELRSEKGQGFTAVVTLLGV